MGHGNPGPAAGLSRSQIKKLVGSLDRRHVHQRQVEGRAVSYIEGWFAIAEANAIFGFDGWDRETLHVERVFEQSHFSETSCAYTARVRVRVHAGVRDISREGTGFGMASLPARADAHERAIKAAETDATKRALATFGNRFGLSLYNNGRPAPLQEASSAARTPKAAFILRGPAGETIASNLSAEAFCGGLRQLIEKEESDTGLSALRAHNAISLESLRRDHPALMTGRGSHFAEVLERLFGSRSTRLQKLSQPDEMEHRAPTNGPTTPQNGTVDKSRLALAIESRVRDKNHLLRVAAKPCLLCSELPCHAHHITFAQPRGMSLKVSDEFTVPLCPVHHNLLHMHGNEAAFWRQHGVDPLSWANQLWRETLSVDGR